MFKNWSKIALLYIKIFMIKSELNRFLKFIIYKQNIKLKYKLIELSIMKT